MSENDYQRKRKAIIQLMLYGATQGERDTALATLKRLAATHNQAQ